MQFQRSAQKTVGIVDDSAGARVSKEAFGNVIYMRDDDIRRLLEEILITLKSEQVR